jgi:hypothetical protein
MARAARRTDTPKDDQGTRAPRTAVLVVHGMGDQRPMDTLQGVVDGVLGPAPDSPEATPHDRIKRWIKPYTSVDHDFDLKCITTEGIGPEQRRYDFYEFYWAHMMTGTRLVSVLLWLCDLAKRERTSLPAGTGLLWVVIVSFLVLIAMAVVHIGGRLVLTMIDLPVEKLAMWQATYAIPLGFGIAVSGLALAILLRVIVKASWTLVASIAVAAGGLALLGYLHGVALLTVLPLAGVLAFMGANAFFAGLAGALLVTTVCFAIYAGAIHLIEAPVALSGWVAFDVITLSLYAESAVLWLLGLLLAFAALASFFLTPYIGDVARYLRDAPDNIECRNQIRALGLKILGDLHDQTTDELGRPRYDRIVVVAHSLGTIVAYDVLRSFFAERIAPVAATDGLVGSVLAKIHRLGENDVAACDAVASWKDGSWQWLPVAHAPTIAPDSANEAPKSPIDAIGFQVWQRDAFKDFTAQIMPIPGSKAEAAPWRVSDFVTMGSPLTHAVLLMTNRGTRAELERKVEQREFPVSPPRKPHDEDGRVFYWGDRLRSLAQMPSEAVKIQHSSLFALTCWTNLYFAQQRVVRGDFIGGPIDRALSPGVVNVPLSTTLLNGHFNHTHYWVRSKGAEQPAHIHALRLAVLGGEALAKVLEDREGTSAASPAE